MSKENLDQFFQKVTDSEELQARVGEEIDANSLIALGAEHGCEFTADDLAAGAELSDEELDGVAGGIMHPFQDRDDMMGLVCDGSSTYTDRGPRFRIGRRMRKNDTS